MIRFHDLSGSLEQSTQPCVSSKLECFYQLGNQHLLQRNLLDVDDIKPRSLMELKRPLELRFKETSQEAKNTNMKFNDLLRRCLRVFMTVLGLPRLQKEMAVLLRLFLCRRAIQWVFDVACDILAPFDSCLSQCSSESCSRSYQNSSGSRFQYKISHSCQKQKRLASMFEVYQQQYVSF